MTAGWDPANPPHTEEEGGCGVTGFACSIPVGGRHIYEPSVQMHNRGNGKGGGIAAVGPGAGAAGRVARGAFGRLSAPDRAAGPDVPKRGRGRVHHAVLRHRFSANARSYRRLSRRRGSGSQPAGDRAVLRAGEARRAASDSPKSAGLTGLPEREIEDEFVYQNTFQLNSKYYASLGDKQAFVLSRGTGSAHTQDRRLRRADRHLLQARGFHARTCGSRTSDIPRAGRVWHPGGAHPFCGLNEALVHNGDFANYHSVTEYLAAAQHRAAVPHGYRGLDSGVRPLEPGLQVSAGVYHRGTRADRRARLRHAPQGEAGGLPADPARAHPRVAGRPVVLHHRAERCRATTRSA